MGKMAKIAKAGKWLGKKAGDLGTSISMKTKKQFGTKDRQVKATEGDPSFKRGFFNRKTFFQGKTQKAAQQLEKQVFHGVNSLKLQETAHKANAYTAKLKAKEESINALRKQSGTIGKAKGLLSWGFRTKAQKDLSVAIRNQKYLKEKKKQYEVESTKLLNKLKGQSTAKTNTVLAQKTSLSNALTHLKKSHNTKMEAAKTAKQAEVDKLKRLVSVKTTVNSDFTKATKDYYDAKQSGKVITNGNGKPIPLDILRTKMVTAKQAQNAFNTSSQATEIKTLGKKLKTEKKIQYIKAENLGNVARGSKKGMEVKNKATRATFTASLNVRQARKDAIKGTLKKLQQYAAPETQEKLAKRITEADALLKNTTKKGIYTKQERQAIKDGLKARAIFGAFSRTGVEIQLKDPKTIQGIIAESQQKREKFIKDQGSQILLNKAQSVVNTSTNKIAKLQKFQLFRRNSTKEKQLTAERQKQYNAIQARSPLVKQVQKEQKVLIAAQAAEKIAADQAAQAKAQKTQAAAQARRTKVASSITTNPQLQINAKKTQGNAQAQAQKTQAPQKSQQTLQINAAVQQAKTKAEGEATAAGKTLTPKELKQVAAQAAQNALKLQKVGLVAAVDPSVAAKNLADAQAAEAQKQKDISASELRTQERLIRTGITPASAAPPIPPAPPIVRANKPIQPLTTAPTPKSTVTITNAQINALSKGEVAPLFNS
jgi:hypothetical protein